jgi:putative N6-adenine-specific DNA methylase
MNAARAGEAPKAPIRIEGYDRDAGAIAAARANAERAGVADDVEWAVQPLSALASAAGSGLVAINPPYGVRVGETGALRNLYAQIGNTTRAARPGWSLALLSADRTLEGQVHAPFIERLRTTNGGIPVRVIAAAAGQPASERPSISG